MLWLVISLTVLGLVLLAIEVIVPGMIVGALGLLALAGAIVAAFVGFGFVWGCFALGAILLVVSIGFAFWLYLFPRTFIGRRLMLNSTSGLAAPDAVRSGLVGKPGIALTGLRPSGRVEVDGKRYDVVAEGGFVAEHEPIRIVSVDAMRIVVRAQRVAA